MHNAKYDLHVLRRHGVDLRHLIIRDTALLHHLCDENASHKLDFLAQLYFSDNYKEVFWSKYPQFDRAPHKEQVEYACKDVVYTYQVYKRLMREVREQGLDRALIEHSHELLMALYNTEVDGVKVDLDYLVETGVRLKTRIDQLEEELRLSAPMAIECVESEEYVKKLSKLKTDKGRARVTKPAFNWASTPQVMNLLYDKLGLPPKMSRKTKKPTVDDDALEGLKESHPVVPLLMEYRGHHKVFGSYIEGTRDRLNEGRIHPSFNINGCVTGRISSSDPNLQQLPRSGGIRRIYVADPSFCFISCDYQQLEVVIAAHFSGDPNLLKIVLEGASQHDITAEGLGIPRQQAKTVNFAMQYGAGFQKLQHILNCSAKAAKGAFAKYWETYPGVRRLMDECHKKVDDGSPIVNPYGRRRRFPVEFEFPWEKQRAYRQAFNSLIQGTGADITHEAFYTVDQELRNNGLGKALLEVHDEIVVTGQVENSGEIRNILPRAMEAVGRRIGLSVPLGTDCSDAMSGWED